MDVPFASVFALAHHRANVSKRHSAHEFLMNLGKY